MSVTMKELAAKANISRTAVSMILNGKTNGHISLENQLNVLKLAKKLNFHPNAVARGLRTGRLSSIGILMPTPSTPFYADMATLLQRTLSERGYVALFSFFYSPDPEEIERAFHSVVGHGVCGVISWEHSDCFAEEDIPAVLYTYFKVDKPGVDMVIPDLKEMTATAVSHLTGLGHTRIAAIGNLNDPRLLFLRSELEKFHIEIPNAYLKSRSFPSDPIKEIVQDLFKQDSPPTAILCHDDLQAAQVHSLLIASGKKIPDDVALLSFNDSDILKLITPSVTAFDMKEREIAGNMIDLLFERIEGKSDTTGVRMVHPRLVIRSSTQKKEKEEPEK